LDSKFNVSEDFYALAAVEPMVHCRPGTFDRPLIDEATTRCVGVITKDGEKHYADRVVMATGAWSPSLIDLAGQCVSKVSQTDTYVYKVSRADLMESSAGLLPIWSYPRRRQDGTSLSQ
jgi:glycine/D-amino acid oxidase-like deaminating enzyme